VPNVKYQIIKSFLKFVVKNGASGDKINLLVAEGKKFAFLQIYSIFYPVR